MVTSDDDDSVWSDYAKGIKQISRALKSATAPRSKKEEIPADKPKLGFRIASRALRVPHNVLMKKGKPFQELLDRQTERHLKQGSFMIDARLDLHGMTQQEAYNALGRFLDAQIKTGNRNLLIITGKGKDGTGALRSNLSNWLEALPSAPHILGLRPAAPKHGGNGAFYLILRRPKEPRDV
ncbi:MAG TPA: Smr/MutS family protein [Alphaproteobacteria bacterium]|nr:Smr/MutS family protein [Alphaproteobacteria bacterium]